MEILDDDREELQGFVFLHLLVQVAGLVLVVHNLCNLQCHQKQHKEYGSNKEDRGPAGSKVGGVGSLLGQQQVNWLFADSEGVVDD